MSERRKFDLKKQHYVGEEGRLIPLLQQAQQADGFLSRERIEEASFYKLLQEHTTRKFLALKHSPG